VRSVRMLAAREHLQRLARDNPAQARASLRAYLRHYPLETSQTRQLRESGVTNEDLNRLRRARRRLFDLPPGLNDMDWVAEFRRQFQQALDEAALERVEAYSRRASLSALQSPDPLLDRMVFLYSAAAMISDLARIYNLRTAFGSTPVVFAQTLIRACLDAGRQEAAKDDAPRGPVAGSASRTTQDELSGLLIRRLGLQAMRLLQPTHL